MESIDFKTQIIELIEGEEDSKGWITGWCPKHERDGHPHKSKSLRIDPECRTVRCMSQECFSGPINVLCKFLEIPEPPPPRYNCMELDRLHKYQQDFDTVRPAIAHLAWNRQVCKELGVGWDKRKKAFVFPVWDDDILVQVWYYRPGEEQSKKYKAEVKDAEPGIFGRAGEKDHDEIFIAEGFGDTVALISSGYNAFTAGGRSHFGQEHVNRIVQANNGGRITIVPDKDKTGEILGGHLVRLFRKEGVEVTWRVPPSGTDVTEAFLAGQYEVDRWPEKVFEPVPEKEYQNCKKALAEIDQTSEDILFEVEAVVSGKYSSPYPVPAEVILECPRLNKACDNCEHYSGQIVKIPPEKQIEFIGVPKEKMESRLKKVLDRPRNCPGCNVEISDNKKVVWEECRIKTPHTRVKTTDRSVDRKCFIMGDEADVNSQYLFKGLMTSYPESQEMCFVALEKTVMTGVIKQGTCPDLPYKTLEAFLQDIIYNTVHIYKHDNAIIFSLLTLFSPLFAFFEGQRVRLYMETLLLGDTEVGKSEIVKKLFDFYKVGKQVDSDRTSRAGLLGGVSESGRGRNFITPGAFVEMDRMALFIEEIGNLNEEVFRSLRESRSSGMVKIELIEKFVQFARTRLIASANPAKGKRRIESYNYPIEAIFSVIPGEPDIRRFDGVAVLEDSVSLSEIDEGRKKNVPHIYTEDIARKHLLWVWSLTEEDIIFKDDVGPTLCLAAKFLSKKSHKSLPLLNRGTVKWKVLRFASALAAFLGSHENHKLVVSGEHIKQACEIIYNEYTSKNNQYFNYCEEMQMRETVKSEQQVIQAFKMSPFAADLFKAFHDSKGFYSRNDVIDFFSVYGMNREQAQRLFRVLDSNNCLVQRNKFIFKSDAFKKWGDSKPDIKNKEELGGVENFVPPVFNI